ncbi:MAG: Asp-tRNA(Asn)/Glu-tRNA(Gln) amidotransferase subunit GatC [Candidatus Nomurabacteria bacterium]|jgi:aspartyl-tRNA(Asn)/glutamyl-tRNA(Gln) amidotransferase subunit C|nr:Asp-tRNA(Asn)/Glu-tRNA(Gln) amidotransferase subunit GatC [Candidatus Nomurabacteria bacterium]
MKIDLKTARHLAALSSITLSDDELTALTGDLENIVEYISELGELDTAGVEPTYQVTGLQNVMRDDVVLPQIPREELLSLAPERTAESVKVPRVL